MAKLGWNVDHEHFLLLPTGWRQNNFLIRDSRFCIIWMQNSVYYKSLYVYWKILLILQENPVLPDLKVCEWDGCNKTFYDRNKLRQHMKYHEQRADRIARGVPLSPKKSLTECTVCGKVLKYKSYLKAHMMTHNNEAPFQCDQCGQSYPSSKRLADHIRYSHFLTWWLYHTSFGLFVCFCRCSLLLCGLTTRPSWSYVLLFSAKAFGDCKHTSCKKSPRTIISTVWIITKQCWLVLQYWGWHGSVF